jgi:uncharacterized protein YuzE
MVRVQYDDKEDILYVFFKDEISEIINTAKIVFGLDNEGNISSIGIKDSKKNGIIDKLILALSGIRA